MFKCEFCSKEFKAKRGLKNHIDKFHPNKITYEFSCEICNKGFHQLRYLLSHIVKSHKEIKINEYFNKLKIQCKYCGKVLDYDNKFKFGDFCNQQHYESYNRKDEINFKCEICQTGFKDKGGLQQHLGKMHEEVNQEDYYRKYLLKENDPDGKCLWCCKKVNFSSFTDGYNKFCYNTDCNVRYYNKNSNRKEAAAKSISKTYQNDKSLLPQNKEYWIKKGFTEEEAKIKVKERQTTFSKEKCIEKYGEKEGIERWKKRQYNWLKSFPKQNYSQISQKLFWSIFENIKNKYSEILFATNDNGIKVLDKNKEFKLKTNKSVRSLDFYIPEINKCIEFDGTYWHGEIGKGNKTRDKNRDNEIIEKIKCQIFHVKEKDYKENPEKVLNECLEFING